MTSILSSVTIAIAVFATLAIIKTTHFYKCVNHKSFGHWFYFDRYSIVNSGNEKSRKTKKVQNLLSVIIMIAFILLLIVLFVNR